MALSTFTKGIRVSSPFLLIEQPVLYAVSVEAMSISELKTDLGHSDNASFLDTPCGS